MCLIQSQSVLLNLRVLRAGKTYSFVAPGTAPGITFTSPKAPAQRSCLSKTVRSTTHLAPVTRHTQATHGRARRSRLVRTMPSICLATFTIIAAPSQLDRATTLQSTLLPLTPPNKELTPLPALCASSQCNSTNAATKRPAHSRQPMFWTAESRFAMSRSMMF
jgi:hypothetical protein